VEVTRKIVIVTDVIGDGLNTYI